KKIGWGKDNREQCLAVGHRLRALGRRCSCGIAARRVDVRICVDVESGNPYPHPCLWKIGQRCTGYVIDNRNLIGWSKESRRYGRVDRLLRPHLARYQYEY